MFLFVFSGATSAQFCSFVCAELEGTRVLSPCSRDYRYALSLFFSDERMPRWLHNFIPVDADHNIINNTNRAGPHLSIGRLPDPATAIATTT